MSSGIVKRRSDLVAWKLSPLGIGRACLQRFSEFGDPIIVDIYGILSKVACFLRLHWKPVGGGIP